MEFDIGYHTSVSDVALEVNAALDRCGYAIIRLGDRDIEEIIAVSAVLGTDLGLEAMSYHILETSGRSERLGAHVESVFLKGGSVPIFALACLQPSDFGGETRIFDGRLAAKLVGEYIGLPDVVIEYRSVAHPDKFTRHRLVSDYGLGPTLLYRSRAPTNRVIQAHGWDEDKIYAVVEAALEQSIVLVHPWQKGDLLMVNNRMTLHDRLAAEGHRRMLRFRYNDPLNTRITY